MCLQLHFEQGLLLLLGWMQLCRLAKTASTIKLVSTCICISCNLHPFVESSSLTHVYTLNSFGKKNSPIQVRTRTFFIVLCDSVAFQVTIAKSSFLSGAEPPLSSHTRAL